MVRDLCSVFLPRQPRVWRKTAGDSDWRGQQEEGGPAAAAAAGEREQSARAEDRKELSCGGHGGPGVQRVVQQPRMGQREQRWMKQRRRQRSEVGELLAGMQPWADELWQRCLVEGWRGKVSHDGWVAAHPSVAVAAVAEEELLQQL